ncbi:MAG: hypothetical protein WD607_09800 [Candidatus Paceibacterota bacterium]
MNTLMAQEKQALEDALDDEYKSWTTYNQVIKDFGVVTLFIILSGFLFNLLL